jgi:hypothetical protein
MQKKTPSERLRIVNEVKLNIIKNNIQNDLASKTLFTLLNTYHENGTTYTNKELNFITLNKKYIINLYDDVKKKDTVVIRTT